MPGQTLSVRELHPSDIPAITHYWLSADLAHLSGMGVDPDKLPTREEWTAMLTEQLSRPIEEKQSYCIIWQVDGRPVGHCNINMITFEEEAHMHLHLWNSAVRQQGLGVALVKMTLPHFFEKYRLKRLYCEPYALNPAPNRTLEKVGFAFIKTHRTIPGSFSFEQEANLWEMSREKFFQMK